MSIKTPIIALAAVVALAGGAANAQRGSPGGLVGNRGSFNRTTNISIGNRAAFGGLGVNRFPGAINRPGSLVGVRPPIGGFRPGFGDSLGFVNRPGIGINPIVTRPGVITRPGFGYGGWSGRSPYLSYHRGWVNGFWNPNYSTGWGWNTWGNSGIGALGFGTGVGLTSWGMGSYLNSWGYSSYVNPYFALGALAQRQPAVVVQQQPVVYDYSRPIDLASPLPPQGVIDQAVASFDSGRTAFKAGDYARALQLTDQALRQTPNDPMLHQFRAICLFAVGRYDEAAVPLYTVLSVGPGWDWTTLIGLYPDIGVYTRQLRALEAYCDTTPRAAAARFVLAALYMTQGSNAAAIAKLREVVDLQPRDRLAAQLLDALTAKRQAEPALTQAEPAQPAGDLSTAVTYSNPNRAPDGPAPPRGPHEAGSAGELSLPSSPVPAKLVGSWTAVPAEGVTITLNLDGQKGFTWNVAERGQSRGFHGAATFDDGTLALAPSDQPPMVGRVTWKGDRFRFKALGAPAEDPGLDFGK